MAWRRGVVMNLKKVYRLYKEESWAVRRRGGRKRAIGTRVPLARAACPNAIWVLVRVGYARQWTPVPGLQRRGPVHAAGLGGGDRHIAPGRRIVRVLERLVALWCRPAMIVSDNGT